MIYSTYLSLNKAEKRIGTTGVNAFFSVLPSRRWFGPILNINMGFQESCSGRGGGIHVERGSLSLVGVSFEGNTAEAHQV